MIGGLATAAVVAGLAVRNGGGNGSASSGTLYTEADAERIAQLAPVTPGWPAWPEQPEEKAPSTQTPDDLAAKDPIYAEYRRKTARITGKDDDSGSGNRWVDDDKLANLSTGVFATSEDAHEVFVASNELSRRYGAKYGFVTRAEAVAGLGDEAWRLWANGNGAQVTYHWRRDNLMVEAHIHCFGTCPPDVDRATRAWADALDAVARGAE